MRFLQWILGGITVFSLLYLISINANKVAFFWLPTAEPLDAPVYMILITAFGGGYLVGLFYYWLGSFPKYLAHQKEKRTLERRIHALETELEASDS